MSTLSLQRREKGIRAAHEVRITPEGCRPDMRSREITRPICLNEDRPRDGHGYVETDEEQIIPVPLRQKPVDPDAKVHGFGNAREKSTFDWGTGDGMYGKKAVVLGKVSGTETAGNRIQVAFHTPWETLSTAESVNATRQETKKPRTGPAGPCWWRFARSPESCLPPARPDGDGCATVA